MKKLALGFLIGCLLTAGYFTLVSALACTPLGTTTPILGLCLPSTGETGWGTVVNANYTTLDALFQGSGQLKVGNGGTGLTTAGADTTKALMSNGSGAFVMSTPPGLVYAGTGYGATLNAGVTSYESVGLTSFSGGGGSVELQAKIPVPQANTFTKLYVRHVLPGATANTTVWTVRKNGVDTAITVSYANNAAEGTSSDLIHSATFAAGDLLSIKIVNNDGGNPSSGIAGWILQ